MMHPFVRGGDAGLEVPDSAVGESKGRGAQKAGHRSELQRRPDAGPSAYALLRAWNALRNPGFFHPSPLRLSEPLHSHLHPRVPASHPLRFLPAATASGGGRKIAGCRLLCFVNILVDGGPFLFWARLRGAPFVMAGNARPWRGRGSGACGGESMVLRYRQCKRRGQKLASKQAFEWT